MDLFDLYFAPIDGRPCGVTCSDEAENSLWVLDQNRVDLFLGHASLPHHHKMVSAVPYSKGQRVAAAVAVSCRGWRTVIAFR